MSPTLPTYTANRNINANPAAPFRQEAAQPFQDQQNVLTTLQQINQQWSNTNNLMQLTEAKAKHGLAVADIESRAIADPDFKNSEKYFKELDDAKKESLKNISNQQVANQAALVFNHTGDIAKIKIKANAQKKFLADNENNVQTSLDTEYGKMAMASPTERLQIEKGINATLEDQVKSGTMGHEKLVQTVQKAQYTGATRGIFTDPDKTIADLKDEQGIYRSLPIDDRLKLIERADAYKNRIEKEKTELQKEVMFNNESNIVLSIAQNGQIPSASDMANMVHVGTMDADFAESALKAVTDPDAISARTDGEEFANLTSEIMKASNKDQLHETVKRILKGGGDGKLSKPDMQILVQSAISQGRQRREDISKAVETLGNYADQSSLPRADLFREFQKNVAQGKELSVASDEAIKKVIVNTIPGAANLSDVPNVIIGKDNKTRYIFNKNTNISAHRIYQRKEK